MKITANIITLNEEKNIEEKNEKFFIERKNYNRIDQAGKRAYEPLLARTISAMMARAISSGVWAPMFRPMGA